MRPAAIVFLLALLAGAAQAAAPQAAVHFATGSRLLDKKARHELDAAIKQILADPSLVVQIDGYSDTRGTQEKNLEISQHRAESVARYLQEHGVSPDRISGVLGHGWDAPVASNAAPRGQALNRRAEILVLEATPTATASPTSTPPATATPEAMPTPLGGPSTGAGAVAESPAAAALPAAPAESAAPEALTTQAAASAPLSATAAVPNLKALQHGIYHEPMVRLWDFNFQNTARVDHYAISGDPSQATYAHLGTESYDDWSVGFGDQVSALEKWNARASGTFSDSYYHTTLPEGDLQNAWLSWQKADVGLPFKAQAGDFIGMFSQRTLNENLKGGEIELQPYFFGRDSDQSIELLSGQAASDYRTLGPGQEVTGASWLLADPWLGSLSAQALLNAGGPTGAQQIVRSVDWGRDWTGTTFKGEAEGEWAYLNEESGPEPLVSGAAAFSQAHLTIVPWNLGLSSRYEKEDAGYQPASAPVTSGQENEQFKAHWAFDSGLAWDARYLLYTTNYQAPDPVHTDVEGLTLSGPYWTLDKDRQLTGNIDAFVQEQDDDALTERLLSYNGNGSLSYPLKWGQTLRPSAIVNFVDNYVGEVWTQAGTYTLAVDQPFDQLGWKGTLTLGASVILNDSPDVDESQLDPTLSVTAANGNHQVKASLDAQEQGYDVDSLTYTAQVATTEASYTYTTGPHQLILDLSYFERNPSNAGYAGALRVGASWVYTFEAQGLTRSALSAVTGFQDLSGPLGPLDLAPGADLGQALEELSATGVSGPAKMPGLLVFQAKLLPDIDRRQRFVVANDQGKVVGDAMVLDFDATGDMDTMDQTYQEVKALLVKLYGQPEQTDEVGSFSSNVYQDLANGVLRRRVSWTTQGGTLVLDFPHRTDGIVRMELRHSASGAPDLDLEALR